MCLKYLSDIFFNYTFLYLNSHQRGFRKGCSTHVCLLAMLKKWKTAVDKGKSFGALLVDLLKAFDCLSHNLLPGKLHVYEFNIVAMRLIHSYLEVLEQK